METDFKSDIGNELNKVKEKVRVPKRICVLENVADNVQQRLKLQGINIEVVSESSALSNLDNDSRILFILHDFEGPLFDVVSKTKHNWILGPTAVMELLNNNLPIAPRKNNVYCLSMDGLIFYLSIQNKEIGLKIATLIRCMGGSIRKNYRNITHMISYSTLCGGYEYASLFLIPVITPEWVEEAWKQRNIIGFKADNEEMILKYKLKPFAGLFISFIGFPVDNDLHIRKLKENEGMHVNVDDYRCTHVVISTEKTDTEVNYVNLKNRTYIYIVQSTWFWDSIELGEKLSEIRYEYKIETDTISPEKQQLASLEETTCYRTDQIQSKANHKNKRRSKDISGEEKQRSESLMCSMNISASEDVDFKHAAEMTESSLIISARSQDYDDNECDEHPCIIEFIQTEQRYIKILEVILQIQNISTNNKNFKEEELISKAEAKILFGNIEGIANVHKKILDDVTSATNKTTFLPKVLIKYTDDLMRLYPVFSNGFEESQRMLQSCSKANPKFKRILKEWQEKQESGRQHLGELLIRPIQRLGSISLLLKEIYRTTPENSSYRQKVQDALKSLEEVMSLMNNDKERTDQLSALFEIFNCIKNCPADLISSHRSLVIKFMGEELTGRLAPAGDCLVFFLFNDMLEVCHVRERIRHLILAGESEDKYFKATDGKPYKHLITIPIQEIRRVIDIQDYKEISNSFALALRKDSEINERVYSFRCMNSEPTKSTILKKVALLVAQSHSSPNVELYLSTLWPHEVDKRLKPHGRAAGGIFNVVRSLF